MTSGHPEIVSGHGKAGKTPCFRAKDLTLHEFDENRSEWSRSAGRTSIERTFDPQPRFGEDMRIDLRRRHILVAKQLLQRAGIAFKL
jgi:hypothetical protein